VAGIANDGQDDFVLSASVGENSFEAIWKFHELFLVSELFQQVARSYLGIFDATIRRPIQIVLKSWGRERSLRHLFNRWSHKLIPLALKSLIQSHRIFKVVPARAKIRVFNHASVLLRTVTERICRRETLLALHGITTPNLFLEALRCAVAVCCWDDVFSLDSGYETRIARDTLISVVVTGSTNPSVWIFAAISDGQPLIVRLLSCVDCVWALLVAAGLKVSHCLGDFFAAGLCPLENFRSASVAIADSVTEKLHFVWNVPLVARNVLAAICHNFILVGN